MAYINQNIYVSRSVWKIQVGRHFPLTICHLSAKLFQLFICEAGKKPRDFTVHIAALGSK